MAPLSWTIHRARETPTKTVIVTLFIVAFVGFSWVVFGPALGALGVVVLFLATNTYFLPITYTLDQRGIEVDKRLFTARYEWKQFRRWFRTSGGIVVSPFSRRSFLDNFRGVHLLLPADPQPICAYLQQRFAPPAPNERLRLEEPAPVDRRGPESETQSRDPGATE
ncbi:hypothetical protein FJY70_05065 [candidate division WOR-3 bacterium]|nr:hypothetical protein [candidate division WOR-3 bacterium]